jgi:hypothetical protein
MEKDILSKSCCDRWNAGERAHIDEDIEKHAAAIVR